MPTLQRLTAPKSKATHPTGNATRGRTRTGNKKYQTKEWKSLRAAVLQEEPYCRHCDAKQVVTLATEVDHITPVRLGGAFADRKNLQPLCKKCHDKKSSSERNLKPTQPRSTKL